MPSPDADPHGRGAKRVKVLLLIKGLGLGGAERILVALAEHRDTANFDYHVAYALAERDELAPELEAAGVPVHPLGARSSADVRWLVALRRLLVEERFDVVHSHLPYTASFARLVALSLPARRRPVLVYTEHSLWKRAAVLTRALNGLTVGADRGLFVVSPAARDALPRRLQAGARVVVHGVDLQGSSALVEHRETVRTEVRTELGLGPDDVLALTVANFRAEKGHHVLLDAAQRLAEATPRVRVVLVGWGPLEDDIRARVHALGIGTTVTVVGRRDDTRRLMAGADLFVLPSTQEGMPVVLMEALSVGLPVVASRVGGVPDIVEDGRQGLLVPPGEPSPLAEAIGRLAADPALRGACREAALARAGELDVERTARRIEASYVEWLAERRTA